MELLVWSSHYSVGVDIVDQQHRKLLDLVNRLHDALQGAEGDAKVKLVLKELVDYTLYHFKTEEELFEQHKYPAKAGHKTIHDKLVADVSAVVAKFEAGDQSIKETLMVFLTDWLKDHILGEDKAFGNFFKEKQKATQQQEEEL